MWYWELNPGTLWQFTHKVILPATLFELIFHFSKYIAKLVSEEGKKPQNQIKTKAASMSGYKDKKKSIAFKGKNVQGCFCLIQIQPPCLLIQDHFPPSPKKGRRKEKENGSNLK